MVTLWRILFYMFLAICYDHNAKIKLNVQKNANNYAGIMGRA